MRQAGAGALSCRVAGLPGLLPPGAPDGPGPIASAQGLRVPAQPVARGHRIVRGQRGRSSDATDAWDAGGGTTEGLSTGRDNVGTAPCGRPQEGNHIGLPLQRKKWRTMLVIAEWLPDLPAR